MGVAPVHARGVGALLNSPAACRPFPGGRARPQPSLNITPLQNRQREKEGEDYSPNQKRPENLSEKSFFFPSSSFSLGYSEFVSLRFDPLCGPGWCWRSAQREAHCVYANWTTWPLYAFGHIWRQRRLGGYSPSEASGAESRPRPRCVCLITPLCSVAMSCLDVMYHQSYGAHYLPAAAYKATYYNHHHQQQQVRHPSAS